MNILTKTKKFSLKKRQQVEIEKHERGFNPITKKYISLSKEKRKEHRLSA